MYYSLFFKTEKLLRMLLHISYHFYWATNDLFCYRIWKVSTPHHLLRGLDLIILNWYLMTGNFRIFSLYILWVWIDFFYLMCIRTKMNRINVLYVYQQYFIARKILRIKKSTLLLLKPNTIFMFVFLLLFYFYYVFVFFWVWIS